jgi:hypothetical protein
VFFTSTSNSTRGKEFDGGVSLKPTVMFLHIIFLKITFFTDIGIRVVYRKSCCRLRVYWPICGKWRWFIFGTETDIAW